MPCASALHTWHMAPVIYHKELSPSWYKLASSSSSSQVKVNYVVGRSLSALGSRLSAWGLGCSSASCHFFWCWPLLFRRQRSEGPMRGLGGNWIVHIAQGRASSASSSSSGLLLPPCITPAASSDQVGCLHRHRIQAGPYRPAMGSVSPGLPCAKDDQVATQQELVIKSRLEGFKQNEYPVPVQPPSAICTGGNR
jgi:hypothetical protein